MLLVDDILFSPVRAILWIFREIHNQACDELANEPETIAQQLRNLYMQLETTAISEEEFDTQEKVLLDRLDAIQARADGQEQDQDQDQDQEQEQEEREETPQ